MEPISVKIDNCNDEYCEVRRSQPAHLALTFKPSIDASTLTSAVSAQFAGRWMPWPLGAQSKVCDHLANGIKCPVKANQEATYNLDITIPRIAPVGTQTVVQVRIVDTTKSVVACTRIPVLVAA